MSEHGRHSMHEQLATLLSTKNENVAVLVTRSQNKELVVTGFSDSLSDGVQLPVSGMTLPELVARLDGATAVSDSFSVVVAIGPLADKIEKRVRQAFAKLGPFGGECVTGTGNPSPRGMVLMPASAVTLSQGAFDIIVCAAVDVGNKDYEWTNLTYVVTADNGVVFDTSMMAGWILAQAVVKDALPVAITVTPPAGTEAAVVDPRNTPCNAAWRNGGFKLRIKFTKDTQQGQPCNVTVKVTGATYVGPVIPPLTLPLPPPTATGTVIIG